MTRAINKLVVHCSDSSYGDAALIREWHLKRGFRDIGYHYVILNCYPSWKSFSDERPEPDRDGKIEKGRPLDQEGAHVRGYNADSIGICLIGKQSFTGAQLRTLRHLIRRLHLQYPGIMIYGHRELDSKKTCPNISPDWIRSLLN